MVNLIFPLSVLLLHPILVAGFPQGYSVDKEYPDIEPKYQYQYAVTDDYTKSNFQAEEERDGFSTLGSYRVALPDGRIQIVTYSANESGYTAEVTYEGEAVYPEDFETEEQIIGVGGGIYSGSPSVHSNTIYKANRKKAVPKRPSPKKTYKQPSSSRYKTSPSQYKPAPNIPVSIKKPQKEAPFKADRVQPKPVKIPYNQEPPQFKPVPLPQYRPSPSTPNLAPYKLDGAQSNPVVPEKQASQPPAPYDRVQFEEIVKLEPFSPSAPQPYKPEPQTPQAYRPEPSTAQQYRPQPLAPQPYRPEPLAPQPYRPESPAPQQYRPEPSAPQQYRPQPPAPQLYRPEPRQPAALAPEYRIETEGVLLEEKATPSVDGEIPSEEILKTKSVDKVVKSDEAIFEKEKKEDISMTNSFDKVVKSKEDEKATFKKRNEGTTSDEELVDFGELQVEEVEKEEVEKPVEIQLGNAEIVVIDERDEVDNEEPQRVEESLVEEKPSSEAAEPQEEDVAFKNDFPFEADVIEVAEEETVEESKTEDALDISKAVVVKKPRTEVEEEE